MTRYLLIQATGAARAGQLATLEETLTSLGMRWQDVQQHVMAGRTTLMLLLENSDEVLSAPQLQRRVAPALEQAGLEGTVEAISEAQWRALASYADRQIMTVMGPRLTPEAIAQAERMAHHHGLTTVSVERRSGRRTFEQADGMGECVEFVLQGAADMDGLRQEALTLGQAFGVDIVFQPADQWRHCRRLICFDMDSTLIKTEVINELAERHGVHDRVADITERAMRGELDFRESFTQRMAMLEGLDQSVLEEIAAQLPLMDGAEHLFAELKRLGYRTAILSGGFTCFAKTLQQRLGIDDVYANVLDIDAEGKVTGNVVEPIVDAQCKADTLRALAEQQGITLEQTVAVGDGANDLKMLGIAGLGVAWHAKPKVKAQARQAVSTLGLDALLYLLGHDAQTLNASA
ncbi:phosphoserine phosphatase SerB [Zymobacter palmae]|uniref:Phosphoserine phosphatase n=1 Tax=Zymobacter palmae TaxID=33074 RepID=A0A348HGI6_9GAMM|nr:phosphoserine phosphatase SerB [Zymobacter palmae]BBG30738.1 phosphoserine phosphatase [Zymobacter palmae]